MSPLAEHDDSGSITPSGRFARMESSLQRIEDKLDTKAEHAEIKLLEQRVTSLERIDSNRVAAAEALLTEKLTTAAAVKEVADMRYRTLGWVVGTVTVLNVAIAGVLAFTNLVNGASPP